MTRKADLSEKVLAFIRRERLIPEGAKVCVCFSGGADSTSLLHILDSFREELHIELSACHLHHGIRGKEADRDADFCRNLCESLHVPLFYHRVNVPELQKQSGKSMEETARDARYSWFSELQKTHGIDLFATAHQKNDLAETVLQRIIRGTTVEGLGGIPVRRDFFVRPLLCADRQEIERFLCENGWTFLHDSTNDSVEFTRNYIRHKMIPAMEEINPRAVDAICRLSVRANEDSSLISSVLHDRSYSSSVAVLRRTIEKDYESVAGTSLCAEQIDRLVDAVHADKPSWIPLPGKVRAYVENGIVSFEKETAINLVLKDSVLNEGVSKLGNGMLRIAFSDAPIGLSEIEKIVYNLSTEIPLRSEGICGMIRYRSRVSGDQLCRFGVHRDVRKLFSEQKIPVFLRNLIPVFYDDLGPFFIPFVGIADRVYTKEKQGVKWIRVDLDEQTARKVSERL